MPDSQDPRWNKRVSLALYPAAPQPAVARVRWYLPLILTRNGGLDGVAVARWLLGSAHVGDGPTAEQVSVIQSLLLGYFGREVDAASLSRPRVTGRA